MNSKTQQPTQTENDVLRRMLSTPPDPKIAPKPKPKTKAKPAKKVAK